jgi:transposase
MDATDVRTKNDLPSDYNKLLSYSWNLTLVYQQLLEKHAKLLGSKFGKSSEKLTSTADLDALQMEMDELLKEVAAAQDAVAAEESQTEETTIEIAAHRRRRKKHGRNSIPAELITTVTVDIPDEEKKCSCCGTALQQFDVKEHLVVDRIPARYTATRYLQPVYGCPGCKNGVTSKEMPVCTPVPKGLASVALMVFVLVSKYNYHLPLYRIQRQIYHESRIWFTRSTLCTWVKQACGLLERIYMGLLDEYHKSTIKHADETRIMVKVMGKLRECWMWTGLSGDGRTAVFYYNRHRSGAAALEFLSGSSPGDYLMVDDCSSYNKPTRELKLRDMRCMAHIRRKFVEAHEVGRHKEYLKKVIIKIGQLYRLERYATKKAFTVEQRTELRQSVGKNVTDEIKTILMNPGFSVLPQSVAGNAINHFLNNWEEATRYLEWGALPIDNTADERINRPFTIGRNNWGQAGSESGARWMAILYTIITTCKLNNIDPETYLTDILLPLSTRPGNTDVSDLLPINWYKKHNNNTDPIHTPLYPSKN